MPHSVTKVSTCLSDSFRKFEKETIFEKVTRREKEKERLRKAGNCMEREGEGRAGVAVVSEEIAASVSEPVAGRSPHPPVWEFNLLPLGTPKRSTFSPRRVTGITKGGCSRRIRADWRRNCPQSLFCAALCRYGSDDLPWN